MKQKSHIAKHPLTALFFYQQLNYKTQNQTHIT